MSDEAVYELQQIVEEQAGDLTRLERRAEEQGLTISAHTRRITDLNGIIKAHDDVDDEHRRIIAGLAYKITDLTARVEDLEDLKETAFRAKEQASEQEKS